MSTDLRYLAFTAILTASLWIPYVVCQVMTNGPLKPKNYAPFAALVIAIHLAGRANAMTAFWAMSFFWLRLAQAVIYLLGIPYLRTMIFTLGYVAVVGLFWQLIK
jgi:hypothetical protein